MRRVSVAIAVVVCACLASCMPIQSVGRSIGLVKPKPNTIPAGPDSMLVEVAPLIVPIGDRYANEGVWTATDEQVLPADVRARLQDNGFRVGLVVSGHTPDGLQQLLTSPKSNPDRNSESSTRKDGGQIKTKPLAELQRCEFPLRLGEQNEAKAYDSAKCQFEIIPTADVDGRIKLTFTPQIEFDDKEKWKRLNPNLALPIQGQRSTESLVPLRFEVSVAQNDYVVIGARFDKQQSVGFKFFLNPDRERPSQRLLAVRAGRFKAGKPDDPAVKASPAAQAAVK
jgi:hypothetical protein